MSNALNNVVKQISEKLRQQNKKFIVHEFKRKSQNILYV